jgi:hypothetical protein
VTSAAGSREGDMDFFYSVYSYSPQLYSIYNEKDITRVFFIRFRVKAGVKKVRHARSILCMYHEENIPRWREKLSRRL